MKRREFIRFGALSAASLAIPSAMWANSGIPKERIVVLVELEGGNDGLNTVIPYQDPHYYELRGTLAVPKEEVLALDERLGLHPKLSKLKEIWDEEELAIVLGVGYPDPNRSHFRSIDIWTTASGSGRYLSKGWIGRLFETHKVPGSFFSDSLTVGNDDTKPFTAPGMNNIVFDSPQSFLEKAGDVAHIEGRFEDAMLSHIVNTQNDLADAVQKMKRSMENPEPIKTEFPKTKFGKKLENIAFLLKNGIKAPVFKVALGSFDTHQNQAPTHERLLEEFSDALRAFKEGLIETGHWDKTVIMTYSEFGRRPAANASNGTDHGTAAPHFMLGGKVKGGFYSKQPSLTDLDSNGDLKYTTDYRSLYRTIVKRWWGIEDSFLNGFAPVECIA